MGHQVEVTRRTQAAPFPTSGSLCLSVRRESAGDFFQHLLLSSWQGPVPVLGAGTRLWVRQSCCPWGAQSGEGNNSSTGGLQEHRRGFWNPDWRRGEGVLEHETFQLRPEREATRQGLALVYSGMRQAPHKYFLTK